MMLRKDQQKEKIGMVLYPKYICQTGKGLELLSIFYIFHLPYFLVATKNILSILFVAIVYKQRDGLCICSPEQGHDPVAEEATLMKNMFIAIVEERYKDAGG